MNISSVAHRQKYIFSFATYCNCVTLLILCLDLPIMYAYTHDWASCLPMGFGFFPWKTFLLWMFWELRESYFFVDFEIRNKLKISCFFFIYYHRGVKRYPNIEEALPQDPKILPLFSAFFLWENTFVYILSIWHLPLNCFSV